MSENVVINLKPNDKYVLLNGIYFNENRDGNSISSKLIKRRCPKLKTTNIYSTLSRLATFGIINSVGINQNRTIILTEFGLKIIEDLKKEIDVLRYVEFIKNVKVDDIFQIKNIPDAKNRIIVNSDVVNAMKNNKYVYILVVDSEIANEE